MEPQHTERSRFDASWDTRSRAELFELLIGDYLGSDPGSRLGELREFKRGFADWLSQVLSLQATDRVADLGSGCGFVAGWIAPRVQKLHCVDISASFVEFCREELARHPNATVDRIPFADLSVLEGRGVTKLFACSVFIHFHLHDAVAYLREIARLLPKGGLLAFDFMDADRLDLSREPLFDQHQGWYRSDRSTSTRIMHWLSGTALHALAPQLGFRPRHEHEYREASQMRVVWERI